MENEPDKCNEEMVNNQLGENIFSDIGTVEAPELVEETTLNDGEYVEARDPPRENTLIEIGFIKAPNPGMLFNSLEALVEYYRKYAKQEGFGITRQSLTTSTAGTCKPATITCSRTGKTKSIKKNVLNPNPVRKIGCKARVNATVFEAGNCRVNSVVLEHNHDLSPSKSCFYLSNREISIGVKRKLVLNDLAGLGASKNFQTVVAEAGGYEEVTCLEKDCRNHIEKARRLRLGEGDAEVLYHYFVRMQAKDSNFFYAMDIDEDDCSIKLYY